ncbi:MAG: response regulator [Desulfosalsimonadaceae bacterium]|nr:response regulator [Desulfosalsimonadaceae bacterium]
MIDVTTSEGKFDLLRRQAEKLVTSQPNMSATSSISILELVQELKVYQAELEIQNQELQRAQQELSDLHREYVDLYDFAPCGYATLNPKGRITKINLTGAKLLGNEKRAMLQLMAFNQFIAPEGTTPYFNALKQAGETGDRQSLMLQLGGKDRPRPIWVRADIQADRDDRGAVNQWRMAFTDITHQHQAEEEKKRLEAQLQQAQKMESIGTLAGGIAHEFNNILSIIMGNNELAIGALPEWNPVKENLEDIRIAGIRASDVVRQLLAFSRKAESHRKPLDMAPLVKETIKLIRSSIPADIEIRQNIPEAAYMVNANATQIHQVMINLCKNAADAMMETGGILSIDMDLETFDENSAHQYLNVTPGVYVKLVIRDTGTGMEEATLVRLFEPYFTTKEIGKGTGIGLAVVYGIINQYNGSIFVESEPGKGTAFTLLFPKHEGPVACEPENVIALPRGTETILMVDDEPAILKLNKQRLEKLGYQVRETTDPKAALGMFQAEPDRFDLVITDMAMPHMTGDQMAAEIFKIRPGLPILLCTGYSEKISEDRSCQLGICAFAMKPLSMNDFAWAVRKAIGKKK